MPLDRARAQWCLYLLTMFNSQGAMDSFQVDSMTIENCLLVKKKKNPIRFAGIRYDLNKLVIAFL